MNPDSLPITSDRRKAVRLRIESASFLNSKVLIWALGFAQLIYLLLDIYRPLNINDEGVVVYGAARILNGDIPYRDFWMVGYTPGQFYVLAGLFKLFGPSILVERIWDILVRFAISFIAYLIVRKMSSFVTATIAWVLITITLLPPNFYYGYVIFPALLAALLSVLLLLNYASRKGTLLLIGTGVLVGITVLFRYDIGVYALLADAFALMFVASSDSSLRIWSKLLSIVKAELRLVLGACTVVAPVFLYFVIAVPISTIWSDLVEVPYSVFYKVRVLPYPPIIPDSFPLKSSWMSFYFPVLVSCIAITTVIILSRRRRDANENDLRIFGIIALICLGMFCFVHALNRNDEIHRVLSYVPAIMVLMVVIPPIFGNIRLLRRRAIVYAWFLVIALYVSGLAIEREVIIINYTWNAGCSAESQLDRAGCISSYENQGQVIDYIQSHTTRDQRIYVGLSRHDRIFANDSIFYFLADRQSATKYDVLVPGVATTLPVQREIIQDITKHNVTYVVLFSGFESIIEPNESNVSSGVVMLDDFIRQNYRQIERFGDYTIWKVK